MQNPPLNYENTFINYPNKKDMNNLKKLKFVKKNKCNFNNIMPQLIISTCALWIRSTKTLNI